MNKVLIGVDPGLDGAIAVLHPLAYTTHDIPVLQVKAGKKVRRRYNVAELVRIFRQVRDESHIQKYPVEVWLENVHAMPGQGVTSMFNMGRGLGMYEGIITSLEMPLNYISPVTWKRKIMAGQGREKGAAVYKAQQLFPSAVLTTPRGRKLDGRAEALLIAEYGKRFGSN